MSSDARSRQGEIDERLAARLFERANGVKWGLSCEAFAEALGRSLHSHFRDLVPSQADIQRYLESLHLEELALAVACAEGKVSAWAYFIECFRPALRKAACAIAGDQAGAELADSLYAELYGLEEREGRRRSLFDYFHGRSRLATWLRAVLAQTHIDCVRAGRRLRPLDENLEREVPPPQPASQDGGESARFAVLAQEALTRAIGMLEPRERLRLSFYYLQRQTLARIGRLMGEHEATVSRKLDRTRRELRAAVERSLRDEHHLSNEQVQACIEAATLDTTVDLTRALDCGPAAVTQDPGGASFSGKG